MSPKYKAAEASYMNFPGDHPLHIGCNGGEFLSKADVILVIDADVPWMPAVNRPNDQCTIFYIDIDPIKTEIPLWHVPVEALYQADSFKALEQLNDYMQTLSLDENAIKERYDRIKKLHDKQREEWAGHELPPENGIITPEFLTACIRKVIDQDTIVINETITSQLAVLQHLPRNKPGTMFLNGGSSLGWNGGAALGAKLAKPDKTIVSLTGDGSYLFSIPVSVHWMSRRYDAPFLTVIYNNQGWNATKKNLLNLYPDGYASQNDRYWVNFHQPADLSKVAEAAGGAFALQVSEPGKLLYALQQGIEEVQSGRSAVIDVKMQPISLQVD